MLERVDFYKLLDYLDKDLIPAMEAYDYRPAVKPLDLVLGLSGCPSSFTGLFRQMAEEEGVSLYQLIVEVSKKDRKKPTAALIHEVAQALR